VKYLYGRLVSWPHLHCTTLSAARCAGVDRHVLAEVRVGTLGLSVTVGRGGRGRPETAGGNCGCRPLAGWISPRGREDAFF
jgi:hypothetical protein